MKKMALVIVGFLFVRLSNALLADDATTKATVLHCHDGDTCRLKVNNALWMNVRLAGVDAPEVGRKTEGGQPLAQAARDYLNTTLKDKDVEVRQTDLDQYNRPIVELFLEKKLVNVTLIEQGLAEAYKGKTKRLDKQLYATAEDAAKNQKKGIWSSVSYVSPADYRKAQKVQLKK